MIRRGRRVASPAWRVLAALCLAWLATGTGMAQDPRATAAQEAARDWLVLTDRGDAQASWNAAGKRFQDAMSVSGWSDALKKERVPLGAVRDRTAVKTTFRKTFPGVPEGDYALVAFSTNFADRPGGHETVTLEFGADGKWHVVGYLVG